MARHMTKTITATVEREKPTQVVAMGVEEAAAACGLGRSMLYILMKAGRIRSIQLGRRRLIPLSALHDFIESQLEEQRLEHARPARGSEEEKDAAVYGMFRRRHHED